MGESAQVALLLVISLTIVTVLILRLGKGRALSKGERGERLVDKALRSALDPAEYWVATDVLLPTRDGGSTQIDHIVISPFGIFVIETKNKSGWIFGGEKQRKWVQTLYRRKYNFQNPLHQNYLHCKTVQEIVGVKDSRIFNVVAFVGSAEPQTQFPNNVVWNVVELVNFITSKVVKFFTDEQREIVRQRFLDQVFPRVEQLSIDHEKHVAETIKRREQDVDCPKCGAAMIVRTNKTSRDQFLGCSRFPNCNGSRSLI